MANKPLPIQVGTIVRNEAARLPVWLAHWQAEAERVVVLDQHSTDGTAEILADSGVVTAQVYPVGIADTHWDTLLAMSLREQPFFRLGVDEFVDREVLEKMLAVMRKHPHIALWWDSRKNLVNGVDLATHPEIKTSLLYRDWQPIISVGGRPYSIPGRAHVWPKLLIPSEMAAFMDPALQIEHRRTLEECLSCNASRAHMCRTTSGNEQEWFSRICREVCGVK